MKKELGSHFIVTPNDIKKGINKEDEKKLFELLNELRNKLFLADLYFKIESFTFIKDYIYERLKGGK